MIKRILIGLLKVTAWLFFIFLAIIVLINFVSSDFFQNLNLRGKEIPLCSSIVILGIVYWLHKKGEASQRQIPSIAVAMGIFFTFVGLSWSLLNIAPSGIAQGTETLIAGLSTAFFSSVLGLLISVGYRIYFASIEKSSLQKMESQAEQAEKIVKDFASTIEEGINNSTRKVIEEFNDNLRLSLSKQIDRIEALGNNVETLVSKIETNLSNSNNSAINLTKQVKSTVDYTKSTSEQLQEISTKLLKVTDEFAKNVHPIEAQVKQISDLTPTADKAMDIISQLNSGTAKSMQQVAARLEEVTKVVGTESQKSIDNFSRLFAFVDTEYKGIVEKNLQSLDKSIRDGFEVLPTEFRDSLQSTFEQYIRTMNQAALNSNIDTEFNPDTSETSIA